MTLPEARARRRSRAARFVFLGATCLLALVFGGLGLWQLQRLAWKLDLIARVEARIQAPPVAAPGPAEWRGIGPAADEYRRIALSGRYLDAP